LNFGTRGAALYARMYDKTREMEGRLLRLFEQHCVNVHSLKEGDLELGSASGRFTAGLHGLLAQLEREKIIENIHLGNEQAVRTGYWINRAPTGYNAVDRVLVPNDDAHLIRRAFKLRAGGQSYPQIEQRTGLKYSTVRHALENKVYLGFTRSARRVVPRQARSRS
jgi:site-specific DNA recombinase